MRRLLVAVLLLPVAAFAQEPPAAEPVGCVKRVFEKFCVGADVSTLPPGPTVKGPQGAAGVQGWQDGAETTVVAPHNGRIARVMRVYEPGTWLTYRRVEQALVEKYGPGKDESFFPSYARDSSSQETAIALKKGRAQRAWSQPGYTIGLSWSGRDSVVLFYNHEELSKEMDAVKKDQL